MKAGGVTRNSYDAQTAAAYKASREIPRDGLSEWRAAVRRHLRPTRGMTLMDIGAGAGQFATAFSDWFDISVIAVEPSAAMRAQIPRMPSIEVRDGNANALPLPDASVDAAWLSLVIHHVPDLAGAAREIRRVLRPGSPVPLSQVVSALVDDASARDDVRRAVAALHAADDGDDDVRFVVDSVEDHELAWYAAQEIGVLVELET